jgi:hypothetical protein
MMRGFGAGVDEQQLIEEIHRQETRRLIGSIRELIFREKVVELGLVASEEEVDWQVEEIFDKVGMTGEKAKDVCERARLVYEGLMAWQANRSLAGAIYEEKLAGSGISREEWKLFQLSYDSAEKLKGMVVPGGIEDMKRKSRESSRKDVLGRKVEQFITREVSVKSEEVEEAYRERYGSLAQKPGFQEVAEKLGSELLVKKKQEAVRLWWLQQYRQADIEIRDPRFQHVLGILRRGGEVR